MQRVQCLYSWEQDSRKLSNKLLNQKKVSSLLNLNIELCTAVKI